MYIIKDCFKNAGTSYLELTDLVGKDVSTIGFKAKMRFSNVVGNQAIIGERLKLELFANNATQLQVKGTYLTGGAINVSFSIKDYSVIQFNYLLDLKFYYNQTSVAVAFPSSNQYTSFRVGYTFGTTPILNTYKYIEITEGANIIARIVGAYNTVTDTDVLYDEINNIEYSLPQDWIVDSEPLVFKGITFEAADDLSLIFKGITFEEVDRKLMDSLFFAQT